MGEVPEEGLVDRFGATFEQGSKAPSVAVQIGPRRKPGDFQYRGHNIRIRLCEAHALGGETVEGRLTQLGRDLRQPLAEQTQGP